MADQDIIPDGVIRVTDHVIVLTAGEDLDIRDAVYVDVSDEAFKCDDSDPTKVDFIGFVVAAATATNTVRVRVSGHMGGFAGLTPNELVFLSNIAGSVTESPSTSDAQKLVGKATSSTTILIQNETTREITYTTGATWTKKPGLKKLIIKAHGAGGGGAGGANASGGGSGGQGGGGGGAGGYGFIELLSSLLSSTETVVVGTGGAGGAGGPYGGPTGAGVVGGNSSFGIIVTGNGGQPGTDAGPGTGGSGGGAAVVRGGIAYDSNELISQAGGSYVPLGGAGGGDGGGKGGDSYVGDGGAQSAPDTIGNDGDTGGGGSGGGGGTYSGGTGKTGGVGGNGVVIVTEYY